MLKKIREHLKRLQKTIAVTIICCIFLLTEDRLEPDSTILEFFKYFLEYCIVFFTPAIIGIILFEYMLRYQENSESERISVSKSFSQQQEVENMKFLDEFITEKEEQEIIEKAKEPMSVEGAGSTCMIPGKYSREYTDYFIGQLAKFLGFEFFKNRLSELELEEHQKLKLYEDFIDEDDRQKRDYIFQSLKKDVQKCLDKEHSVEMLEDMLFFDGIILNTNRNLRTYGFIVDKEDETKLYEFICFYDEYTSFFDCLNGINLDDYLSPWIVPKKYYNAWMSQMSWFNSYVRCVFSADLATWYVRERHLAKLKKLEKLIESKHALFKNNDQFKLDDYVYVKQFESLDVHDTMSIYEYHILRECVLGERSFDQMKVHQEMLLNSEKRKEIQQQTKIAKSKLSPSEVEALRADRKSMLLLHYRRRHIEQKLYEEHCEDCRLNGRRRFLQRAQQRYPHLLTEKDWQEIKENHYEI